MEDATPAQRAFMERELERFISAGAFERSTSALFVSRMFLVPKGVDKWRIIIDLRHINQFCETKSMKFETLKRVRQLARRCDYMLSLDLLDGYYAPTRLALRRRTGTTSPWTLRASGSSGSAACLWGGA